MRGSPVAAPHPAVQLRYVASPASRRPRNPETDRAPLLLHRRGVRLGWVLPVAGTTLTDAELRQRWHSGAPVPLHATLPDLLPHFRREIRASQRLMERIVNGADGAALLCRAPYRARLAKHFEMLASYCNEGDLQEIATLEFDAVRGSRSLAENLWLKLAWLSFEPGDASMRFRFSFGIADLDDVSTDLARQRWAARLAEAVFPESAIITANASLKARLRRMLGIGGMDFLERIVYFNAPGGGAQFHHDVERAHLGVIFAQLTGRTAWLALAKPDLIAELRRFLAGEAGRTEVKRLLPDTHAREHLLQKSRNARALGAYLDARGNDSIELVINRSPLFTRQLLDRGHGFALAPGDVLLLPQRDVASCCWHSVFCLDDQPGQALSFAIRAK